MKYSVLLSPLKWFKKVFCKNAKNKCPFAKGKVKFCMYVCVFTYLYLWVSVALWHYVSFVSVICIW